MSSQPALVSAASMGEVFKIKSLIDKGEDVNRGDSTGFTPLHAAANGGHADCVEALLTKGKANPNVKDRDGTTPLHLAATNNNIAMVEALIKAGASVNAEDKIGTALHRCATGSGDSDGVDGITTIKGGSNSAAVAIALVKAGAKASQGNRSGRTALHIAVQKNDIELIKALLSVGANKSAKDNIGMTPLDFCDGKPQIRALLEGSSPMPSTQTSPSKPSAAPKVASPPTGGAKFCSNCGTKAMTPGARFCASCGSPMNQ